MTTESLEELRRRLLQQDSVQRMIQMRAYEIFQMRGCQPGGEAQDWFHAEGEVLAFLLASESTRAEEPAVDHGAPEPALSETSSAKKRTVKPRSPRSAATQTTRQPTATKRAATKETTKSKAKTARPRNSSKPESRE